MTQTKRSFFLFLVLPWLVGVQVTSCRSMSKRKSLAELRGDGDEAEIKDPEAAEIQLKQDLELKAQADMLKERELRAARLAKLKALMERAKKELTGYDAILQKVFAFVRDRDEGKRGPAKIIPIISWPGYGKTYFVEWLVENLELRDRYYYNEAKEGDSYIDVKDMAEKLRPIGERIRGIDGIIVTDEAQRIDTTPFEAETFRTAELAKINAELEASFGPPSDTNQNRANAQRLREQKLENDLKTRQRRYDEDVKSRQESTYLIRTSTAGNGTVEVGGGVKPADHIAEIEKVVKALLDSEVTGLSPGDQTKRNDLLREKDQAQSEYDAKFQEREGISRKRENNEKRKAVTALMDKLKKRIVAIDKSLVQFVADPATILAEMERKFAALEAKIDQNNDRIGELDTDDEKEAKEEKKLERDNEKLEEEKQALEERLDGLREGKDAQQTFMTDALEALKNALLDYPELMDPFKHRIPERYREASQHYFLLEAFRLNPTQTLDTLRKKAASLPPGQRKFAGGFLRLMLMNATEVQSEVKKKLKNPRDPDEVHRKASEFVATPEGKSLLGNLFKKIFGSTIDNDSLFSRVGDPEVIVPWDRSVWKSYVKQQIKKNMQQFQTRLKAELGIIVDVTISDSVVDLAYRMGANAEYGPRSMDNVYGVVLGEVKGDIEAHAIKMADGDFDKEFRYHLNYDPATNKMQAFDTPTSGPDIAAAGQPPGGRVPVGEAVVAGGDKAKVPGEEATAAQTDLSRRLKSYRVSSSALAAMLFFGSAPAGLTPGEGGAGVNKGITMQDLEEAETITKKWYPNPDIGLNLWEYELYTLLTRMAGVESDIIQVNSLSPESEIVLKEMGEDLPKFIEHLQTAASQAGYMEEGRPSLRKFLASVDRYLLREPLFQVLAKKIPDDPKSAEYKTYMEELLLTLRKTVRARLVNQMMPLRASPTAGNPSLAISPRILDIMAGELGKNGSITPERMTEIFTQLYKRPVGYWQKILLGPLAYIPVLKRIVNPLLTPVISLSEAGKWVQTGCRVLRGRQLMDRRRDLNAAVYGKANPNL